MRSLKITKTVLSRRGQISKLNIIDEDVLKQLVYLLKPFKHMVHMIQTDDEPSLYMVLICSLTLKTALTSFVQILKYQRLTTIADGEQERDIDSDPSTMVESEGKIPFSSARIFFVVFSCLLGVRIIRLRILKLFECMFELDSRYCFAALLYLRYRQLKECINTERDETHRFLRARMVRIMNGSKQQQQQQQQTSDDTQPQSKKQKFRHFILRQYEDDDCIVQDNSSGSEDFPYQPPPPDGLSRYLAMDIPKKG